MWTSVSGRIAFYSASAHRHGTVTRNENAHPLWKPEEDDDDEGLCLVRYAGGFFLTDVLFPYPSAPAPGLR